ncbi:Rex4 [Kluyveromyces lactis]|nr:Rex4 [Kluyveromyces lactis]
MVLSSNWLSLQKSTDSDSVNKNKGGKKTKSNSKKRTVSVNKDKQHVDKKKKNGTGSKIMDMVANMNKEIAKVEQERMKNNHADGQTINSDDGFESVLKQKLNEDVAKKSLSRTNEVGKYVSMDCEFVGVGPDGKDSALARVSIVNYYGNVVLDLFVRPKEPVTDWRTWVSGIKPHHMANAVTQEDCQKQVSNVLKGRILVGHSVHHDLTALMLSHPRRMIRDTSRHMPFRQKYSEGKTPSLKKLTKEILQLDIQDGEHSSIEDARATMLLYKSDKLEFEKLHNKQFGPSKPIQE